MVARIWKLPTSPFCAACFNVHTSADVLRWKRSVKTADRKLSRRVADALEEAGRGAMDERAITSFCEKIQDLRARRATEEAFADVFRAVAGREMGAGSLRAAINNANGHAGLDEIDFNIPGGGAHYLLLSSALPTITSPVSIAGTPPPGYTNIPLIDLQGTPAGAGANGT